MRLTVVTALVLFTACGGDDGGSAPIDGRTGSDAPGAGSDAPASGGFTTCDSACQVTGLTATFGTTTRTLDKAFYGVTTGGATPTLYVEVDSGLTICPEMNSPTPTYSLILGTVVIPADTTASSSPGNLLDYQGDLLPGTALGQKATTVALTPVAAKNVIDAAGFIAFDTNLVFPDGTVTGHFYAQHCASMDESLLN